IETIVAVYSYLRLVWRCLRSHCGRYERPIGETHESNQPMKPAARLGRTPHSRMRVFLVAFTVFFVCIGLIMSETPLTEATPSSSDQKRNSGGKALVLYAPQPKYPKDSAGRHPTGSGIVVMEIDQKTGWVKAAKMEKSTGSKLLDDAALEAYSH